MPVWGMKQLLTTKEFNDWVEYLYTKGPDVQEIQMAVLSNMVAQGLGSKKSKVDDFIISKQKPQKQTTNVMSADEVSSVFGGLSKKG